MFELVNYCNLDKLTQVLTDLSDATFQYTADEIWDFIYAKKCKSSCKLFQ